MKTTSSLTRHPCLNYLSLLAVATALLFTAALVPAGVAADDVRYEIPFASGAVDPARDFAPMDPADHDLVLVQWEAFGNSDMIRAITETGAKLVQPIAPVNYLVWADAAQTREIRAIDGVRFAGVLPAAARVAANVTEHTTHLRVTYLDAADLSDLPELHYKPRAFAQVGGAFTVVDGGADSALALAADPRVYSVADAARDIQPRDEQSSQIVAQGTDDNAHAIPGYRGFLAEIGANGTGVIAHIMDGGVDFNHPDLEGQVRECFDSSPTGLLCGANNTDDAIGHGTHVLGVILSTGTTPNEDLDGFVYGLGVAPGATAVAHNDISLNSIFTTDFFNDFTGPYQEAVLAGAIVSNNSWGPAGTPQGYDSDTRTFDQIARDANPDSDIDEPIALSWSIMNGSGGVSTQGSPDEAKNILAVGASGARGARSPDDLCTCTAHGPNLDGRRLVDFVAPGQSVVSTRASQGAVCGNNVVGGLVNIPLSPFHGPCTGTSFASPHVTGTISVFTEWFRENVAEDDGAKPSPPLFKAALANTADDLSRFGGVNANGAPLNPVPNDQQGWGRVNLGNLIDAWSAGLVFVDQEVAFTDTGDSFTLTVEPVDPGRPFKVSLAWADAPGHGLGGSLPAWVNDLDLVVTDGQSTWFGNHFSGGWSSPGGTLDGMNNLENVFLEQAGDATYTVGVEASNLMAAASPNAEAILWQDFALVVANARLVVASEQVDITELVKSAIGNVSFLDGVFAFDLGLINDSDEDFLPAVTLRITGIDSASGTVEVINADNAGTGTSPDDPADYDFPVRLAGYSPFASFKAGDELGPRRLEFADPAAELFTFDAMVTAHRSLDGEFSGAATGGGTAGASDGDGSSPDGDSMLLRFEIDPLTGEVSVGLVEDLIDDAIGGTL